MPSRQMETAAERIERLVETHTNTLLRTALHHTQNQSDAEDVVQMVFLKLIRLEQEFADKEHEKAWLIRVTINQCRDLKRSAWHKKTTALEETLPMEEFTRDETILDAVRALPDNYRDIVYLYYFEGYATAEIAQMLEMKQNTVESRLHRARAKLKAELEGEWEE